MKKALVVGIDHYEAAPLNGCVNDALQITELLDRHEDGSKNFDCNPLISGDGLPPVTATLLRESLEQLLQDPVTHAVFHYSGHGTVDDGNQPALVGQDGSTLQMRDLLEIATNATSAPTLILLDCCFAGGLGPSGLMPDSHATVREGLAMIVGSRRNEPAAERDSAGVFSSLVVGALEGGASDVRGHVTVASLYSYVDEGLGGWDQRPALRANVSQLQPLRNCDPLVPESTLRMLPTWFPNAEHEFPLSPDYEPDAKPEDFEKQAVFKKLQDCNRARLVDPVDEDHMYYAAVNSTACRLTALGRRYWRMAKDGRL